MSKNPYVKTFWEDEIVDPTLPEGHPDHIVEEGTPFMATYANNMEEGIYLSHEKINDLEKRLRRKDVQDEINDRIPTNSGSFFDPFDGTTSRLARQTATADITTAVTAGTTVLPVDNVTGFVPFTQITIYDGSNSENVLITAIGTDTITVQTLINSYVKGAKIARSNVNIMDGAMTVGEWGTYSITLVEMI
ncbi:hypothetical protein [Metabacillus fastidiosus]|uniref:hypothetical protein n=1 Tax=Metabacillus fastidiosus TaxID=1458 RepID=UPI002E242297|nr:hypothetical protein [Metabacillus fastidiosus]